MKRFLIAAFCSVLGCASANAQTCIGSVPFTDAPLHAGIGAAFSSNSHSFAPGVAYGTENYFVRGAVDFMSVSGVDASAKGIAATGGAEFKTEAGSTALFVCPLVTLAKIWGPSVEDGFDLSSFLFGLGASVGFVATKTGQTTIVPTLAVSFNHLSTTRTGNFAFNTNTFSAGTSFGSLQIGVGLLFNDRMSLIPSIIVPFGVDGGETSFSVLFSTKVGH
jgi:hypothetical protein